MQHKSLELLKKTFLLLIFSYLLLANICHALPFNIVPKAGTVLPTSIDFNFGPGTAYYTVFNNTLAQRNNNFVKYLPPNVQQVTTGGTFPDTCGAFFNLAGRGLPGSSCTLQLTINGPVLASDPDPHHHLFVCFPGGLTCAGPLNQLNVGVLVPTSITVTPSSASAIFGHTVQYTAVLNYSNGSSINITNLATWQSSNPTVATISPTGLATAASAGTTAITASFHGLVSNGATLTVTNPLDFNCSHAYSCDYQFRPNSTIYCNRHLC